MTKLSRERVLQIIESARLLIFSTAILPTPLFCFILEA
jgi:hypothetical protein